MKRTLCVVMLVALSGCASAPHKIGAMYVSPLQYGDYNSVQIAGELERVNQRISELEGSLKKNARRDGFKTALGVLVFWPTLLMLEGDGTQAQEYARLKGERDALEKVAIQKGYTLPSATVLQASHAVETTRN